MQAVLLSVLPSLVVLGLAALAALFLTKRRPPSPQKEKECRHAARILALATGIQSVHFIEEATTGFPERLGELFGLPAMPGSFFIVFNLAWIGIWIASVPLLRAGRPFGYFAALFLAIAGMINAFAHPLLAAVAGGYFPGLVTSPFIGGAGYVLWHRLQGTV